MPLQAANISEPIAGYTLRERIGAGGYGEVWKADAPGGLMKAVKLVYGYLNEDRATTELKAFNRIKQVRHPFLLSLERIEVVEGQLVIVTELADSSLKDWYEECRKAGMPGIPRDELLIYLHDAADALDYMSKHFSLQHLDVKPENLLIVAGHVKVGDFGLVKDLREGTASLMQGMTPIYAPPEVFDGRASSQSDQYSLAIVFQEMLTGQLPFPGRTLAQLAAQHLHSAPRMNLLPAADRPIVARALSKEPKGRYPTCIEFVNALINADKVSLPIPEVPTGGSARTKAAANSATAVFDADWPGGLPDTGATQAIGHGDTIDERDPSPVMTAPAFRPPERPSQPIEVIEAPMNSSFTALPPVENPTEFQIRPTLFVGAGGAAGKVLARLKQRLVQRLGPLDDESAVQFVALDTDSQALDKLGQGSSPAKLQGAELLALPLRKPQDYRADSKRFLQWLSRRWLYNIPRSHLTEGLRPLGRLAMVDHVDAIRRRMASAIDAIMQPAATARLAEQGHVSVAADAPRVVVVAAISGGTGGGMALDLAYLLRHLLAQRGLSDRQVTGVLMMATDSHASDQELSVVNAYGTLSELYHYSACGGRYPGDNVCDLPPLAENAAPLADAYLVHLGDGLSDQRFEQQIDKVAEYLYRDTATRAAAVLDACRFAGVRGSLLAPSDVLVRTFGISACRIMPGDATAAVESLGNQVLMAILGPPERASDTAIAAAAGSAATPWSRRGTESPATTAAREFANLVSARRQAEGADASRGAAAAVVGEALGEPLAEAAVRLVENFRDPARLWAAAVESGAKPDRAETFVKDLYAAADQAVREAVGEANLVSRLFTAGEDDGSGLSAWLQRATPLVLGGGAARRLVVCAPATASAEAIGTTLLRTCDESANVVVDTDPGVALIYETEQVSLAQLAAALVEDHPEYVDAARRMQARQDIRWSPLPDVRRASN